DVLVGRVRDELVQRVLGVLVRLTGYQNGLGHVLDAEGDPFGSHGTADGTGRAVSGVGRRPAAFRRTPAGPPWRPRWRTPASRSPAPAPTRRPRTSPRSPVRSASPPRLRAARSHR